MKHKRCPFCGGVAQLKGGVLANGMGLFWVDCKKCRVSQLGHLSESEAWAAWDRRVSK